MFPTPNEFRLQAALLILFGCSILTGLVSLTVDAIPYLTVPERLILTREGAPAVMLSGFAILALTFQRPVWRILVGILLSLFGGYGLGQSVLSLLSESGLSAVTFSSALSLLPSLGVLIMAGVSLLGVQSARGGLFGFIAGCIGVGTGAIVLVSHLQQGLDADADGIVAGFSAMAGLYCVAFGVALVLLSERKPGLRFTLRREGVAFGLLGVAGTFALSLLASWGIHTERHQGARTILQHYGETLEHGLESHLKLTNRLAGRWAALDYDLPLAFRRAEVDSYFSDVPALDALMVVTGDEQPLWRSSRSIGELLWLMAQVGKPEVQSWMRQTREQEKAHAWFFPDRENPLKVLSLSTTPRAEGQVLAVFDIEVMLLYEAPHRSHEFDLALMPADSEAPLGRSGVPKRDPEIYETLAVKFNEASSVVLSARAGPPDLSSLRGLFPVAVLVFGLWMSYLLIMGRNLLGAYKDQTRVLDAAEQEFRSLFSQSPDAVFAFDKYGYYRALNSVAMGIVGLDDSDIGVTHYQSVLQAGVMSEDDQRTFVTAFGNAAAGHTQSFEVRYTSPDGTEPRDYECDLLPIVVDGTVTGVFIIGKDITERQQAQESERILKRSLESSDNGVVVVDRRAENLPVVFVNPAFSQMTGYPESEVLGAPVYMLIGPETDEADIELIRDAVKAGEPLSLTMKSYRRGGTPFWNQVSLAPVRDNHQVVTHYTAIMRDISDKKKQEKRLAFQATHDALTGLGNRALFEDHLEHDFSLAKRSGQLLAVLFIDLDEFKPINDTLGHKVGDELLISVARRLGTTIRPSDTLARFGGDEFVLILPDLGEIREAEQVAERILEELAQPHMIGAHELYISASIGISELSGDVDQPEKLLQRADMAMYKAKQQGRDTYEIFSPDLNNKLSKRVVLRNELQEAIKFHQLFLYYQPQVDEAGNLCGLEALVRWKHPQKGFISPADFIPVAEETGQIVQLGKWVTTQACRDALRLREMGLLKGRMAVNLSPLQFHRPSFLSTVRGVLESTGLPAECLELELTEGILMKDTEGAVNILHALSGMGIATAIDDFGTGFSSFSYLRDLPVDKIKIDQSFVDRVTTNEKNAAVCKGVITLAREMDLRVIAEGVETEEQVRFLSENGCRAFQGYYFARPMPFDDLVEWCSESLVT
ncbi:EAL domain-containing protein [Marinobacter pelagius]|uniref:putative bifunctional diguanylate cyclase/phosphodiesterase n=1 Tax=Marinobacter sp. C7 TaxID=2951363 RepID=UPI001EF0E5D5|nr:EAL domain-containing protein [Marinobacter sp. C7]MCG7199182.1 EAL domain-containing protein [Marinobacter sp. C7]